MRKYNKDYEENIAAYRENPVESEEEKEEKEEEEQGSGEGVRVLLLVGRVGACA